MTNKKRKTSNPAATNESIPPGQLKAGLASLQRRRNLQRATFARFKPLPEAFDEVLAQLSVLTGTDALHPEVAHLLGEAQRWVIEGIDRILSVDEPHEVEESRKLLELEYLLWDFAAMPSSVDEWAGLEPWNRQSKFGFGKLRLREEKRQELTDDMVIAARDYWITHSVASHPEPGRHQRGPSGHWDWSLMTSLGDIMEHAKSVVQAGAAYVFSGGLTYPSALERLPTAAMEEAWERMHQALHAQVPEEQFEGLRQPRPKKQSPPFSQPPDSPSS